MYNTDETALDTIDWESQLFEKYDMRKRADLKIWNNQL